MAVIRKYTGIVNTCPLILAPENLCATAAVVGCVRMKGGETVPENPQKYVIFVGESQGMVFCTNGRVTEGVTEAGYYEISASDAPQMFGAQQIFYLNAKEIGGIRFGTQSPIAYRIAATGEQKNLRCFGTYALRIVNPLQLCNGLFAGGLARLDFNENSKEAAVLNEEFLDALQRAANKLSEDGCDFAKLADQDMMLTKYVVAELDNEWMNKYGLRLTAVDIASADADAAPAQTTAPRTPQPATIPVDAPAPVVSAPEMPSAAVPAAPVSEAWHCAACGTENTMKFCTECGAARPQQQAEPAAQPDSVPIPEPQTIVEAEPAPVIPPAQPTAGWQCSCGTVNTERFCKSCGMQPPARLSWKCPSCGVMTAGPVCTECGVQKP